MSLVRPVAALGTALLLLSGAALAAEPKIRPDLPRRQAPAPVVTFACDGPGPCHPQATPSSPNRNVNPFARSLAFRGTLGRPCAWRRRATPEGTRKVRVCF